MTLKRDPRHGTQESLERRAREYGHEDEDTEGQGIGPGANEDSDALGARPFANDDERSGTPGPDAED